MHKILVDHRDAVLKISPTRVYRLPAVGVAYGVDRRRKVAVVLSPSTIHEDEVRIYRRRDEPQRACPIACSAIPKRPSAGSWTASRATRCRR